MGFFSWLFGNEETKEDEKRKQEEAIIAIKQTYQTKCNEFREQYRANYKKMRENFGFPKNNNFESVTIAGLNYYIWVDGQVFKLFEHPLYMPVPADSFLRAFPQVRQEDFSLDFSTIKLEPNHLEVPLNQVKKFYTAGSFNTETKLVGGERNFNPGDAMIGGLVAGSLGAIIAGRGQNPYRLETSSTDTRKTFLHINGEVLELLYQDVEALKKIIPSKYIK